MNLTIVVISISLIISGLGIFVYGLSRYRAVVAISRDLFAREDRLRKELELAGKTEIVVDDLLPSKLHLRGQICLDQETIARLTAKVEQIKREKDILASENRDFRLAMMGDPERDALRTFVLSVAGLALSNEPVVNPIEDLRPVLDHFVERARELARMEVYRDEEDGQLPAEARSKPISPDVPE